MEAFENVDVIHITCLSRAHTQITSKARRDLGNWSFQRIRAF